MAGMNVARINFSHGNQEEHSRNIKTIRKVSEKLKTPVAILQDLPGPKLRVGRLAAEPLQLSRFDRVTLTTEPSSAHGEIPVSYPDLPKMVKRGDTVFLADGSIKIEVVKVGTRRVQGRVLVGGNLISGKGVNLPRLRIRVPAVTKEDAEHLKFGQEAQVDIVALSFVQKVDDVIAARKIAQRASNEVFIIAKIEKREAIQNLESIMQETDGVMVARGDLGVELNLESVPIIQKRIIQEANKLGKPVITATQMLESMVSSPTPTRAEVTDVANAILDGTDAVMLSEETAIGEYPVEAVKVLERVAQETEHFLPREITAQRRAWREHSQEDALALAACETALQISASAIVTPTRTGQTARRVSKYHPPLPIIALTYHKKIQHQLQLSWGVHPLLAREFDSMEAIFQEAEKVASHLRLPKRDGKIVIVAGDPKGPSGTTDLLKIHPIL